MHFKASMGFHVYFVVSLSVSLREKMIFFSSQRVMNKLDEQELFIFGLTTTPSFLRRGGGSHQSFV